MNFPIVNKIFLISSLLFGVNSFFSQNSIVDSLFSIKGEQYFSFDLPKNINTVSKIISIDHKSNSQKIYAYANKKEFIDFLDLEIPFTDIYRKVEF